MSLSKATMSGKAIKKQSFPVRGTISNGNRRIVSDGTKWVTGLKADKILSEIKSLASYNKNPETITVPWNNTTIGGKKEYTGPYREGYSPESSANENSSSTKKDTENTKSVQLAKTYTSTLDVPKYDDSKTYYTPVHGQDTGNGTINPIRVGDNRMVETGPTTENLGEAILTSKNIPIESEIPQTHLFLNGLSITPQEFNFANPLNQDFSNVYQGLRNLGYGRRTARRMMKNSNFWNNIINLNSDIYNQQMDTPEGRMALARANFNSASLNFDKYQQGGKMNDEQLQQAFIQFLAQKSGAKNEKELEAYVKQLGEDGLKQAYAEFTEVMQKQAQKAKQGAKLNYIKQLKHQCPEGYEPYYYKKGGMVNCGCKGVKMEDGGKTPKKQSAVEKFKARNNQQNNQNLKGDWQSQKAKEQQRKNREEAAKGEGESPVTDKNFNKGYKKNEKGGKVSKAGAGCMFKSKFVKKGSKVKVGCK